jgi:hypothetical protein
MTSGSMTSRPITKALAPLSLVLFALTSLATPAKIHAQDMSMSSQSSSQPKNVRSIAITATDRVIRPADVATVHIGYQIFGPDQASLYTQAAKTSNAIIDALRAAGVANDSIESDQQSIGPTEPYQINQLTPAERDSHAFTAQQSWTAPRPPTPRASSTSPPKPAATSPARSTGASATPTLPTPKPQPTPCSAPRLRPRPWRQASTCTSANCSTPVTRSRHRPSDPFP